MYLYKIKTLCSSLFLITSLGGESSIAWWQNVQMAKRPGGETSWGRIVQGANWQRGETSINRCVATGNLRTCGLTDGYSADHTCGPGPQNTHVLVLLIVLRHLTCTMLGRRTVCVAIAVVIPVSRNVCFYWLLLKVKKVCVLFSISW